MRAAEHRREARRPRTEQADAGAAGGQLGAGVLLVAVGLRGMEGRGRFIGRHGGCARASGSRRRRRAGGEQAPCPGAPAAAALGTSRPPDWGWRPQMGSQTPSRLVWLSGGSRGRRVGLSHKLSGSRPARSALSAGAGRGLERCSSACLSSADKGARAGVCLRACHELRGLCACRPAARMTKINAGVVTQPADSARGGAAAPATPRSSPARRRSCRARPLPASLAWSAVPV